MSGSRYRVKADNAIEKRLGSPESYLPNIVSPTYKDKISTKRLGPGTYNISLSTLSGPSFGFGQTARFSDDDPFAKLMILTRKSSYQGVHLPEIQIDSFKPDLKLSKIKEDADYLTLKVSATRSNKKRIDINKKEKMIKKIKEKNDKYEIRKKAKDFSQLIERLIYIMAIFTASERANSLIISYKHRKARAGRYLNLFCLFSIALSKFKGTLIKFRTNHAYNVLNQKFDRIKLWVSKRRSKHKLTIKQAIEKYLKKPLLEIIQRKFILNIRFIQQFWRKSILIKKESLQAKVEIFRFLESNALSEIKSKKKINIKKSEIVREILRIRKKKLKKYNNAIKKYKVQCDRKQRAHSVLMLKVQFTYNFNSVGLVGINFPKKPVVSYVIKKRKYLKLIDLLYQKKSLWA